MNSDKSVQISKDMGQLRDDLTTIKGPAYWRNLDEALGHQEIDTLVHREFPAHAGELLDPVSRRNFMKVMGASMMLAGLAGCARQPDENIVPYVKAPEESIPGKFDYYATAMPLGGYGYGVLASSFQGRPTKLDGLKGHPATLGASSKHLQASLLDLYDPDRLDTVLNVGRLSTWSRFSADLGNVLLEEGIRNGAGLRILSGTVTSPTLASQKMLLLEAYPEAHWHQYEPVNHSNHHEGTRMVFGRAADCTYDLTNAQVVLSLDSDFLHTGPGHIRYAQDFAQNRDYDHNGNHISRLYVAESSPTLTGGQADHKINLRYPDIETLARLVAQSLEIPNIDTAEEAGAKIPSKWLETVVQDLRQAGNHAVVIAGDHQPPVVHALACLINHTLGATATDGIVKYIDSVEADPVDHMASLRALVDDMQAGKVSTLIILGGNPVYNTPAELDFAGAIDQVNFRVCLTPAQNETSWLCHWVIPEAHYLEGWGDVRGYDGTLSVIQPLILPLYGGKTAYEVMDVALGGEGTNSLKIIKDAWAARYDGENFENFWRVTLSKGVVEGSAYTPIEITPDGADLPAQSYTPVGGALDVVFRPDPSILDGQFANNGWLQELPKPLTLLTWDNAVCIHPDTARQLHLNDMDQVQVKLGGQSVMAGVNLQFGHPRQSVTVHLGYGRKRCGQVGKDLGFSAYTLQSADSPWFATGIDLVKTGRRVLLARTDEHWQIEQSTIDQARKAEDRHLIREGTISIYKDQPDFAQHMGHHEPSPDNTMYNPEEKAWEGNAWGMTIDLNKCTGCGVCSLACQAENNIPVVGKEEVAKGREMLWIRIDRYYKGDMYGNPEVVHQPVPCMHCENAPCEPVCPVGATVHGVEGLNEMVYNRCVGTRYCANNCPYKVRRFNFFKYADHDTPQLKLMRNPNVTVRSRGVMEKCTYCVQRINQARIDSKREFRDIYDGEVVAACQAACPSKAIEFGNINDPQSRVAMAKKSGRNYGLIADIGTRPRTTYLARLSNPSPELVSGSNLATEH